MILITGANGQLGQSFRLASAAFPELQFYFAGRADLDIASRKQVEALFNRVQPGWCINCAAYTAVDRAESEPRQARRINVDGVRFLAEACAGRQIPLVHFSSDYVYHTRQNTPYRETDPVQPKSVYARTKLAGERAAIRAYPLSMIVRTSWVYAPFGQNFVRTIRRYGRERPELNVVYDQIGAPTYAPDLADAVLRMVRMVNSGAQTPENLSGIWHYANEGVTSWYDFALAILEMSGIQCPVHPIETRDYPTPAPRPAFSVLNKSKIQARFQLSIPHWRDSLRKCLDLMED